MATDRGPRAAVQLDIVAVGDRQIVMTRGFAAPPSLVFDALVTPSLLLQWMHGPAGWRMVDCEFDATEGGHYRYAWRGPNGLSMAAKGVVRQIIRPSRLVTVEFFDDNWTGGEVTAVSELTTDGAGTLLTNTATYPSRADRDTALASGMERGVAAGYAHLDRLLADQYRGAQEMKTDTFDVVSTREFAAPVTQVWRAWSDPDFVTGWWGPTGFTSPLAELDFRIGGTSLVCMRAPAEFGGFDMYTTWTYRRIEPMSLIEFDNRFTDGAGASIPPPPGVPSVVPHLVTLAPIAADLTSMTVTEFGYPDEQVRDQSKAGLEQCLDKMAALLEKVSARR